MLGAYQAAGLKPKAAAGGGGFLLQDYPGAVAAFSLRDLVGTDPTVVRVRRSSDDAEADFTASEVTDGTLESWVGAGNDGFVPTLYSQGVASETATQTNTARQPRIVSGGSLVTENGSPALHFDIGDAALISAGFGLARLDCFAVHSTTDTEWVFLSRSNSNTKYGYAPWSGDTRTNLFDDFGSPLLYHNGGLFTGTTRDDLYLALTGLKTISIINASTSTWNLMQFNAYTSADLSANLKLQELIFYDSDQSSNRAGIETNINNYYGVY